ncbi:hypothetical protein GCM10027047_00180 [Rhodococcus aerolatus]
MLETPPGPRAQSVLTPCAVLACDRSAATVLDLTVGPAEPVEIPVCQRHGVLLVGRSE